MAATSKRSKGDVTLKDIAEAVGKSVAAVSRALNDHNDISAETRKQIKQVAAEMGYRPNLVARRLQKQATDALGFIIPTPSPRSSDPYYSELLSGIASEAATHGFDLLVATCTPGPDEIHVYQRLISSRRVDGVLLARPRWNDERIKLLAEANFPFAVVGACNISGDFLMVADDATEGARLATKHLIAQSHTRLALINGPMDLVFSANFLSGFKQAMRQAGLTVDDDLLEASDLTQKDGYRAAQILLSKPEIPTAIVAADDVVALGAVAAAQDQGFAVGNDVAITGYGDILLTEHSQPPITTISCSTYSLGQKACRMLITRLQGDSLDRDYVTIKPSLVIRQSSNLALWL